MILPILLVLLLVNSCVIAMQQPAPQLILPKNKMSTVEYEAIKKPQQELANKHKNQSMFAALSKLETETNKLIENATSYHQAHDLIYKKITENQQIPHDDSNSR